MSDVLAQLHDHYKQLMLNKLLERKDIACKTTYHPREQIATVFSSFKEILKFTNNTITLYKLHQAINIANFIIHRRGKFALEICKWNCMPTIKKTWVGFKHFFRETHSKLWETTDLIIKDAGMCHAYMVSDVVAEVQ